jgi:hypothetical protein
MSAELAVRAAVLAALREEDGLRTALNGIYDGTPVQASPPHVVLGEMHASDWGMKDRVGRDVRLQLLLFDLRENPAAMAEAMALIDATLRRVAMPGWQVGSVAMLQCRTSPERQGGWRATMDYRVRIAQD